ncbi:unnamed protein product [Soboliphyme baturini]|uniref:Actin maturation protease n=1 Tax=Soboliphyme baturini TaxID=241478 RepID=A0A183IQ72_9BILA|nr:unnamed protein product [Soboliphyme baturini]
MVCLKMAENLVSSSPEPKLTADICETAKALGITSHGEMFSVEWMGNLAVAIYECHTEVADSRKVSGRSLAERILNKTAVLVPYDCDKNFEPCEKAGNTAHWALLVGFLILSPASRCPDLMELSAAADSEVPNLYWICDIEGVAARTISQQHSESLYVFALHGKSKHPGVWPLHSLLRSNQNLVDYSHSKVLENAFRLPPGGVEEGLRNKLLLLSHK